MGTFNTAAPKTAYLGTQDQSTVTPVVEQEVIPTHLPRVYTFAEKGSSEDNLVSGGSLTAIYGANSFDLRREYLSLIHI